jgi:hypothetical protein
MLAGFVSTHRHRSSRLGRFVAGLSSADRLRRHMAKCGTTLAGQKLWTGAEIERLRLCYPDYRRACAALPGRTFNAIKSKALRRGSRGRCGSGRTTISNV